LRITLKVRRLLAFLVLVSLVCSVFAAAYYVPAIPFTIKIDPPSPGLLCSRFLNEYWPGCPTSYEYGPRNVTGFQSFSKAMVGDGTTTLGPTYIVPDGQFYLAVSINGDRVESIDPVIGPDPLLDPEGTLSFNATMVPSVPGEIQYNVTVRNISGSPILNPTLLLYVIHSPPFGSADVNTGDLNGPAVYMFGGRNWSIPYAGAFYEYTYPCSPYFEAPLPPGGRCSAGVAVSLRLPAEGAVYPYLAVFMGIIGDRFLVSHHVFFAAYHSQQLPADWVSRFVGAVNSQRTGFSLVENSTLNGFAQMRFQTMVANYNVSHYGYHSDMYRYFGEITGNGAELYLFPVGHDPVEYTSYLSNTAPTHWEALTSSSYSQFGYYFGEEPAVVSIGSCNITEIPGPGINIPQYYRQYGCASAVVLEGWLVIELAP
jgi:hypothetical protein